MRDIIKFDKDMLKYGLSKPGGILFLLKMQKISYLANYKRTLNKLGRMAKTFLRPVDNF